MWTVLLILAAIALFYFFMRSKYVHMQQQERKQTAPTAISVDNLVDGYEFNATLDTFTPLEVLEHHGEIRPGPKTSLPRYGTMRDGIWLEFFKDYSSRPSKEDLADLEFLKKFRRAYEGDLSHQKKRETISALVLEYRHTRQASFAVDWYLWGLLEIPGVSVRIAKALYSHGITTREDVRAASDKELLNIPGIGPSRLAQIRSHFSL